MARYTPIPATILLLWLALLQGALGGLRDGEVFAVSEFASQTTLEATEDMDLRVQYPRPDLGRVPTSISLVSGDMSSFFMNTSARYSSNDVPLQIGAAASSRVDFYDTITLNIPGLAPGTPVTVRIAWDVWGSASSSSSSSLVTSSRILLSAPPLLVGDPVQFWTRESNNTGDPVTWDPQGRVEFDFRVKVGTPVEGNILLTAAADAVSFLDSQNIPASYSASPGSNLSLAFDEVVSIKSLAGFELPIWTIESASLFDYGEGDGPIPLTDPVLTVSSSPNDPRFIACSWPSSPFEYYTIEYSPNLLDWSILTTVNGTGAVMNLELLKPPLGGFYRLVPQAGTAPPNGDMMNPSLWIYPSPAGPNLLRLTWVSSIHESYILQSKPTLSSGWSSYPSRSGTGGVLYVDAPAQTQQGFFQLVSQLTVTP